ncbi:hypothetical protein L195_g020579 [Trifolium pratense]|uniref:Uncharacterized protein n=1 Tax=Trifolium pratense TaxID=57577 RepID=A0A2K3N2S0_TRIPR|nr:hypothetical protein L195_g020579 [Trifolium pratense]
MLRALSVRVCCGLLECWLWANLYWAEQKDTGPGPVALRDYPHSRHLCIKFPFKTTARESYCDKCYCYVCDSAAPCKYWTTGNHCSAESAGYWKDQRKVRRRVY